MTSQLTLQTMERLAQAYPFIRTELLATTAFGRPIRAMAIGNGPRHVLYAASFHANEWITTPVLLKFAEDYAEAILSGGTIDGQDAAELYEYATIFLVPLVNPDGVDLVTGAIDQNSDQYQRALSLARNYPNIPFPDGWKANLLGTDLNLNWPAGWLQAREIKFSQGYTRPGPRDYVGRFPLDQIEAQALYDYTYRVDPALVLAWHTQGQVIYWQYADIDVPGARELAERFAALSGYELEDVPFNSSFAGYKDWFIQTFRRPGFTIEAGSGTNPLPLSQFPEIYAAVRPILVSAALG